MRQSTSFQSHTWSGEHSAAQRHLARHPARGDPLLPVGFVMEPPPSRRQRASTKPLVVDAGALRHRPPLASPSRRSSQSTSSKSVRLLPNGVARCGHANRRLTCVSVKSQVPLLQKRTSVADLSTPKEHSKVCFLSMLFHICLQ